ncbi:MAG: aminotransferase class I/II-fold pyridoxal phosphate-dependent enzyme [Deltaproteobacteria bacterium]|nr:aminotransferase class I/II-fold pyridoxal phosphate-dependent enzyme [Deltaproteobacteria bacterium]
MSFNPASAIQDLLVFGEFGDVNPSVTDSVTYTFLSPQRMEEAFEHEIEGCFLYSRHWNPINRYLSQALAAMEGTEMAQVTASGMSAIASTILQLCATGDEIVSGRTIYGGTYALFKNLLPRLGITTRFVDITNLDALTKAVTPKTRVLYAETESNPLLEIADIPALASFARAHGLKLVVDNTFTPMIISPAKLGADVVVYSLTKFANGTADAVAGCICSTTELVRELTDVNSGACMLFGPVLDSLRAASLLKNLHSLHVRMRKHSDNALALATWLKGRGLRVHYPGLADHPQHALFSRLKHAGIGYGGMMTLDVSEATTARELMRVMQEELVGYLAVSLGYFKTLFSAPGSSTSSEIPPAEKAAMGLSDGLIRFSVGLDDDIGRTLTRLEKSLQRCKLLA